MPDHPPTHLHIRLLGDFSLSLDGSPISTVDKPRQQSLLAYLALHRGKAQRRSHLAFTFWPDSEEKQALANLRNLLHSLKQSLPQLDSILQTDQPIHNLGRRLPLLHRRHRTQTSPFKGEPKSQLQ